MDKPTKITFAEMRGMGVRGVLIYCAELRKTTMLCGQFFAHPSGWATALCSVCARHRSHQAVHSRLATSQQLVFVAAFPNERQESSPGSSSAQVHCKPFVRDGDDLTRLWIGQADIYRNSVAIPKHW
jgi:hypothetical protein